MQADSALGRVLELVRELRSESAWPRAQTRSTLRPYLVEEALELEAALAADDPDEIRAELGDVLLHVAFQIVLGEEQEEFTAEDVVAGIERKMRRRHPHVFAEVPAPESWERAKAAEPGGALSGLPHRMPPLLRAFRLQERAAGIGFDWPDSRGPLAKVVEETGEVRALMDGNADTHALEDELGDLLFASVNLARKLDVAPTNALDRANRKFERRFVVMEAMARERKLDLWSLNIDELEALWVEAKATV